LCCAGRRSRTFLTPMGSRESISSIIARTDEKEKVARGAKRRFAV
jgi:hypothetical protein